MLKTPLDLRPLSWSWNKSKINLYFKKLIVTEGIKSWKVSRFLLYSDQNWVLLWSYAFFSRRTVFWSLFQKPHQNISTNFPCDNAAYCWGTKRKLGWCFLSSPDKPVLTKLMQQSTLGRTGSSMLMQHMMQFLCLCRWERWAAGSSWGLCLPKWLCRPHPSEQGIVWKALTKNVILHGRRRKLSGLNWGCGFWWFGYPEERSWVLALLESRDFILT